MGYPVNPYIAGAALRSGKGFFGRRDTLSWVARELRNPATSAVTLFGEWRIGKTSLLLQLERTLPHGRFLPVYFDLHDQATRPLGQVLADLADTVVERANLEAPERDAFQDGGRFFRGAFLPRLYAALEQGRRVVFLLDEFDVLNQVAEQHLREEAAARALIPFLRRMMAEDPRLAFVIAVGRRPDAVLQELAATFGTSLVREIGVLDEESAKALVLQAEANSTLRFTDQAVARILMMTNSHPYLTQLLCQRIWERAYAAGGAQLPLIDTPEVEAAVPDALEAGEHAVAWLWQGLSAAEKIYAAGLAEAADEGQSIPKECVIERLEAHAGGLRVRGVESAPRGLVERRVLEAAGKHEHRFAVELFRRWVRDSKPVQYVMDNLDWREGMAEPP